MDVQHVQVVAEAHLAQAVADVQHVQAVEDVQPVPAVPGCSMCRQWRR